MIVTRFAPSPTGRLHLGHAFSAVTAHARALAGRGKFLIRIEVNRNLMTNLPPFSFWQALTTAFGFNLTPNVNQFRADLNHVDFNVGPHGFFDKPAAWTGQRPSPGKVQQAISGYQVISHHLVNSFLPVLARATVLAFT